MSSIWRYYKSVSPNKRILFGLGTIAYCSFALFLADGAEKALGFQPSEEDKKKLSDMMPKLIVIDKRDTKNGVETR